MEALVRKVVEGDSGAWHRLWGAVEPTVWAITGKWQITGPLSQREDERRNIVVEVMGRLEHDGFRRLRAYLASIEGRAHGSFRTWLATVTARTAIDYVRAHPEYDDVRGNDAARGARETQRWVRLVPIAGTDPVAGGADPTRMATASAVLDRARSELRPDQLSALYLWLQGDDHAEIASRLALGSSREADRLVRSALKRLRDRYASEDIVPAQVPELEGST